MAAAWLRPASPAFMLARTAGFRAAGKRAARATASRTAGTSSSRWHSAAAGDGDGEAERKPFVPLGEVNKGGGGISADGSVDEDPTSAIFDDDPQIEAVLRANRQWVSAQNAKDPEYFDKLGQPQTPEFFYIGCSDARVPANQILGLGPGEVFVHRNVANQVIGTDLNMLACLQVPPTHTTAQLASSLPTASRQQLPDSSFSTASQQLLNSSPPAACLSATRRCRRLTAACRPAAPV